MHDEECVPSDLMRQSTCASQNAETASRLVTFKGNTLPWLAGRYGGRAVLSALVYAIITTTSTNAILVAPIEIYVHKPAELSFASVRASLMRVVPLCLNSNPSLIPLSCMTPDMPVRLKGKVDAAANESPDDRDPDDVSFWSEQQAKRICSAIEQVFGVEYAPEVVVADANLSTLARRILLSKEILLDPDAGA
ncbi:hypothetical protein GGX14DRAFT_698953 [Mycena pura]|uniref:Uncharacterized protein n=1 Tax=Mycena pura TaxID=153505 RepID=A0AAD6V5U4_9AGAR|nr:hypothetical protein GGX14DRAFT_698953 [Mycena pura]